MSQLTPNTSAPPWPGDAPAGLARTIDGSAPRISFFFEMFQKTDLADKCAIVTSYRPNPGDRDQIPTVRGCPAQLVERHRISDGGHVFTASI